MTLRAASTLRAARWLVLAALLALFLVALQRLDLARVWTTLGEARPIWLGFALLAYATILPLWALQWQLLAPPDPNRSLRRMLEVVTTTSSVLNTTPMLIGEATGAVLLVTRGGLARSAAVTVLVLDQLLVGIAKIAVLAAAALMVTLPGWIHTATLSLVGAVALLLAGLMLAAWRQGDWERVLERLLPARLHGRFAGRIASLGPSLAPLRSPSRASSALALALAKKGVEVAAVVCLQRAFGLSLPLASAVLALAMLNLATLLPVVPGDVGVYEGTVVVAYGQFGVEPEVALGVAMVQHAVYFAALAVPGLWAARGVLAR